MPVKVTDEQAAERFLIKEGFHDPRVHRVDQVTPTVRWVAFRSNSGVATAIIAGRDRNDWRLVRVVDGWPVI